MKKFFRYLVGSMAAFALLIGAASCDDDDVEVDDTNYDKLYQEVLHNYVNTTIVPTYKAMAEAALEMRAANEKLKQQPTDAVMKEASDAWMKARIQWELSEAFLFGPVGEHALDIDGHIDSWPLEINEIKEELQKIEAGNTLTGTTAWDMDADVIGFHVTEYLLYRDGKSRPAEDVTAAELNYLTAATDALVWDCVLAYVAWVGEENVSSQMKTVFNENPAVSKHLNDNSNYKNFSNVLTTAGGGYNGVFATALAEISGGAAEIADEVGTVKITEPYEEKRTEKVESWYSWHSIDDYRNNIFSIKNAYLGGLSDNSRTTPSLSTYIASKDANLDKKIKDKIEDCLTKIQSMGNGGISFYEAVRDQKNATEVAAAADACKELADMFTALPNSFD